ncbi:hypothetical protein HU200_004957 [Digitaria exilis]|uniref:Glycosyltransferases n=1 Tax=Digitaria exilis TaxID=1010633 RepID=A0A835FRH8_9POAL|nr:hypothetical protein HU200_004957 [Digitaria exilis]
MASPKHHKAPGSSRKANRAPLVLRRTMLHSCLCFLLGLVTGLAPTDWVSRAAADANAEVLRTAALLASSLQQQRDAAGDEAAAAPPPLAGGGDHDGAVGARAALGGADAHGARSPSGAAGEAPPTATLLRRTGVPYRHLTYADNFTSSSSKEERHHQRNSHRLRGVVLFAGLADVYDLRLLHNLRRNIRSVSEQHRTVALEGPVCCNTTTTTTTGGWFTASSAAGFSAVVGPTPPLHKEDSVHGFAFASDLLWDPARWDRFPTSEPDQSQDSVKFLQRLVVEDYNKTTPVILACSHVMAWRVDATLLLL